MKRRNLYRSFATEYNIIVHNNLSDVKEDKSYIKKGDHGKKEEKSVEVDGNEMLVDCDKKY